jgi:hypothetical protein
VAPTAWAHLSLLFLSLPNTTANLFGETDRPSQSLPCPFPHIVLDTCNALRPAHPFRPSSG